MKYQNRTLFLSMIVIGLLFLNPVFAQTDDLDEETGTLPTSKLYFLKSWGEWMQTNIFTFDKNKKAELRLKFAERRLAEIGELQEQGELDDKKAEKLTNKYESLINKIEEHIEKKREKGETDVEFEEKMAEKTVKHQDVLESVFDKVPEQAKGAIERAIEVSGHGSEKVLKRIIKKENGSISEEEIKEKTDKAKQEIKAKFKLKKTDNEDDLEDKADVGADEDEAENETSD